VLIEPDERNQRVISPSGGANPCLAFRTRIRRTWRPRVAATSNVPPTPDLPARTARFTPGRHCCCLGRRRGRPLFEVAASRPTAGPEGDARLARGPRRRISWRAPPRGNTFTSPSAWRSRFACRRFTRESMFLQVPNDDGVKIAAGPVTGDLMELDLFVFRSGRSVVDRRRRSGPGNAWCLISCVEECLACGAVSRCGPGNSPRAADSLAPLCSTFELVALPVRNSCRKKPQALRCSRRPATRETRGAAGLAAR